MESAVSEPQPEATPAAIAALPEDVAPQVAAPSKAESSRESSKRDERLRKKAEKSIEQLLKALNDLRTPEEKLAFMCKKCAEMYEENRRLQYGLKQGEKRALQLCKEKEHLQSEHSKAILTRSRLESLCRELQKQNKAVKDESLLRIREGEEKQREVSLKFQTTLTEINSLMQQNTEKNAKLREENIEMAKKLKSLCEQYEAREQVREQHVEKLLKHKELELQLSEAKLAKGKMEMSEEREKHLKEKQELLLELTEYQKKCQELQTSEIGLRNQLQLYTEKYDDFQKALTRSNDIFSSFKSEMEKMAKKIRKLEKETQSWKQKWETSNSALLQLAADKQRRDAEVKAATKQVSQLEKLCRALQAERNTLSAQLKTCQNGTVAPEVVAPTSPAQVAGDCEKITNQIEEITLEEVESDKVRTEENTPEVVEKVAAAEESKISQESSLEDISQEKNVQEKIAEEKTEEKKAEEKPGEGGVQELPLDTLEMENLLKEQEAAAKQMEQLIHHQKDIDTIKEEQGSIWAKDDSPDADDISSSMNGAENGIKTSSEEGDKKEAPTKDGRKVKEGGRKRRKK